MSIVIVPKYSRLGEGFSKREIANAAEHPGRRTDGSQSAASWVGDLTDLRKCIVLCYFCAHKFNFRRNHYRRLVVGNSPNANGQCDACKARWFDDSGVAYVHESEYEKVCVDPAALRRRKRAEAKAVSVSFFIKKGK